MEMNAEFFTLAQQSAKEILEKIQAFGNGRKYNNPGSVEWSPEVGASFVPSGRTGRYHTISFPYTNSLQDVLDTIKQDQQEQARVNATFED